MVKTTAKYISIPLTKNGTLDKRYNATPILSSTEQRNISGDFHFIEGITKGKSLSHRSKWKPIDSISWAKSSASAIKSQPRPYKSPKAKRATKRKSLRAVSIDPNFQKLLKQKVENKKSREIEILEQELNNLDARLEHSRKLLQMKKYISSLTRAQKQAILNKGKKKSSIKRRLKKPSQKSSS